MSSRAKRKRRNALECASPHGQPRMMLTAAPIAFRAQTGEDGTEGRPTFSIEAYNGGVMKPDYAYWPTGVVIDLAKLKSGGAIPVLLDHRTDHIVGQSTSVKITKGASGGVNLSGVITGNVEDPEDPAGRVVMHAKNGFQWRASVGIDPDSYEKIEAGDFVTVNGREFSGPLYVLRGGTLFEVSLLSVAADQTSSAKIAAKYNGDDTMDFHEWLKAKGFDPTNLEDAQRDSLLTMFKAEQSKEKPSATGKVKGKAGDDKPDGNANKSATDLPADDSFAHIKARREREASMRAAAVSFATDNPHLVDETEQMLRAALESETNPEMFKLQLYRLRSERVTDGSLRASPQDDPVMMQQTCEAAFALSCGMDKPERHYEARILEAAQKRWRSGFSLAELLLQAARVNNGYSGSHRSVEPLLKAAFARNPLKASGPSTFDVSGILSNVLNKFIVDYFNAVGGEWRQISARRSVNDFKAISSYSLTGDFTYEEVAPGGELHHGTIGETTYTNQAKTYGRMFAVDRRDIINDDLNAFLQIARRLGRGGALKLNEVFWQLFMANTSFFTAARGNFDDGTDSALSITSLAAAEVLFMNQTDPDGKPMALMPQILLVPPALKRAALQLMQSNEVRYQDTSTTTQYGTANTFTGAYQVVSTPYLQNASFTGNSALKWYLLGNPNDLAVIETAFLNGVERPTVESAQADFNQLGIQMRGFFDFGIALQEYRAGVAMKGEV